MRIRMLWLGSIVLGALVIGMPRVVWSHGGGGGGGGGGGHGGGGGGGHGGGFGGGGHGGFGGGFGGGHHGGGFGGGYHGGGFGGGYHGGGFSGGHQGGTHIGGAPSIGGSHHSGNFGGAARHNTNTFTQRHIATPTRTVTQGFRGVTSASHLGGTHAQSLLNHRAGLTTATNAPFLRNHHLMGQNGHLMGQNGHHMGQNGFNHRGFGSSFFGFGFPFFGFGFWPYGYGYGGYGGYGYGGYGYGGYGYGYPYYNYGNYGVAQTTDATAPTGSATDAQVFAEKGEADFKKGDYKAAVYAWRHAALDDPQNGVIHMMLAQALFATGQFDEAAGATQHAMQLLQEDQWGVVVTNYRELYGKVGAYTSQLRDLEKAVKQKPEDPATRFLLGFHYAYLGYPSHAVKQLDKTVSLVPQDELAKKLRDLMVAKLPNPADAGPGGDKPAKDPDDGA